MNVSIIGAGYVGLTTAALLADLGHIVNCVDVDTTKISMLNDGVIPIYEPNLKELVDKNRLKNRLFFTNDIQQSIKDNPVILIAVGTPSLPDGSPNLSYIHQVITTISKCIDSHKTIIIKSTVPPGTNEWVYQELNKLGISPDLFDVVSNPEFLKEGSALYDSFNPSRIVVGVKNKRSIRVIRELFQGVDAPYIFTNLNGAELIKYASNAFLATKISFINEMSRICDAYDVDIKDVSKGIGSDPRIGTQFLSAGLGYGGSCFPKDVNGLISTALKKNITPNLLHSVQKVNESQIDVYINKLEEVIPDLKSKTIAVWGLSFKPNTDDTRESASFKLIEKLLQKGCRIHAYDPIIRKCSKPITLFVDLYSSIQEVDALVLATDWEDFKKADWVKVKKLMKEPILLDGRNMLEPKEMNNMGICYYGVGRR